MNKIASDNMINKLNKRLTTIAEKLGTNSQLFKNYEDYFTVHGVNTRKNKKGVTQITRGNKANLSENMAKAVENMDFYGGLKKELRKRGEKPTMTNIDMAGWVKANLNEVKEFVYLTTGKREINGLSGTKGKKSYREMYNILKKYQQEMERQKADLYEPLEDF